MFARSRSSLKNHTRFQTKISEVYSFFQTKKAPNPTHWGRLINLLAYIRDMIL